MLDVLKIWVEDFVPCGWLRWCRFLANVDDSRERQCEENLDRDLETCSALGRRFGKSAYKICEQQAMLRYSICLANWADGAPIPIWGTK